MYWVNKRSGTYVHHAFITLETELINDFNLDYTLFWDRIQNPAIREDGSEPERDDWKSVLSFGYSF